MGSLLPIVAQPYLASDAAATPRQPSPLDIADQLNSLIPVTPTANPLPKAYTVPLSPLLSLSRMPRQLNRSSAATSPPSDDPQHSIEALPHPSPKPFLSHSQISPDPSTYCVSLPTATMSVTTSGFLAIEPPWVLSLSAPCSSVNILFLSLLDLGKFVYLHTMCHPKPPPRAPSQATSPPPCFTATHEHQPSLFNVVQPLP